MALVTAASRVAGYVRDKALAWVLGASALNDAFRIAFQIPNAFRALLAEGALHAAFVPALSRLGEEGDEARQARELVGGLLAALLLILALIVGLGILASPVLVRVYASGFAQDPGKMASTVLMNRLMFGYLAFISLAALCQGILNSRSRFLLPAATPILFNLTVVGGAWLVARRGGGAEVLLSLSVLAGGLLQFAVQAPAVRRLGFSLQPMWSLAVSPPVRRVALLMLPGLTVLGINQVNQLVTSQFASFLGDGAVTVRVYAYRVTELMYGGLVVQITTVMLPVVSRQLRDDAERAGRTLLDTVVMVWFVTLPSATLAAVMSGAIVAVLFGGGEFGADAVRLTGVTLTAYAFSLVGTAHGKVMASSYFAQQNTRAPMWGAVVTLVAFTGLCVVLVGPFGVPGLGWANSAAMAAYAAWLTIGYARRYGVSGAPLRPVFGAIARQVVAAGGAAGAVVLCGDVLAPVTHTSLDGVIRVGGVLTLGWLVYLTLVVVLGGREPIRLLAAIRGRST